MLFYKLYCIGRLSKSIFFNIVAYVVFKLLPLIHRRKCILEVRFKTLIPDFLVRNALLKTCDNLYNGISIAAPSSIMYVRCMLVEQVNQAFKVFKYVKIS